MQFSRADLRYVEHDSWYRLLGGIVMVEYMLSQRRKKRREEKREDKRRAKKRKKKVKKQSFKDT